MARLIDADALRARMYHEAFETDTDMQKWDSGCWIRYKLFENCIDDAPTLSPDDLRGVGEWEVLDRVADMDVFRCSACRSIIHCETVLGKSNFAYCPICGARMEVSEDA